MTPREHTWFAVFAAGFSVLLFALFTVVSVQRADLQSEVWRLEGVTQTQYQTMKTLRAQLQEATTISYVSCSDDVGPQPEKKPKKEATRVTPVFSRDSAVLAGR